MAGRCDQCHFWAYCGETEGECGATDMATTETMVKIRIRRREPRPARKMQIWSPVNEPDLKAILCTPPDFCCSMFQEKE